MSYDRIKPPKISDAIVDQLEGLILEGILKPGERLPPERELAQKLEVSRPSLREALQKLEALGLVEHRQGGGTFVVGILATSFTEPLAQLFQRHPETAYDLLEFRHALEGISAYYAALRATETDHEILKRRFHAIEQGHAEADPAIEAEADAEFHLSIAEAAHNVVLLHIMRGLFDLLRRGIVTSREKLYQEEGVREELFQQHRALFDALITGDARAARRVVSDHLGYVEQSLRKIDREENRKGRSLKRLESLG